MNTPTPEEVKKLLERLKELHEKATQGEWSVYQHPKQTSKREADWREIHAGNRYGGVVTTDGYTSSVHGEMYGVRILESNALLICELHNAFPLLLSLASQSLTATQRADALAEDLNSTMAAWQDAIGVQPYPKAQIVGNLALTTKNIIEERAMFEAQLAAAQGREERLRNRLQRVEAAAGKALRLSDPEQDVEVILGELQEALLDDEIRAALSAPPSDAGKSGYAPFRERIRALAKDLREAGYEYPSDCVAVADFDCPDAAPTPSTEGKGGKDHE